jgi:hypothetical protein
VSGRKRHEEENLSGAHKIKDAFVVRLDLVHKNALSESLVMVFVVTKN